MRKSPEEGLEMAEEKESTMEAVEEGNVENGDFDVGFDYLDEEVEAAPQASENGQNGAHGEPLLSPQEVTTYRARWDVVQGGFIDDPNRAVEHADNLADMVLKRLTDSFAYERDQLVRKWDHGADPVSTEDLRQALQGYRAFLDRLLLL
jgi:hypothetical protein